MIMKKNLVKRYSSISEFEKNIAGMNEDWYTVQCISENNWRVLAVYVLDNKDIEDEKVDANDWWVSE